MRRMIMVLAGLVGIAGATASLIEARAQPSPDANIMVLAGEDAPGAADSGSPPDQAGLHHMRGWHHLPEHMPGAPPLGLIYDAPDKKLSAADVQKIAEAFLLWHGNHAWRIVDVTPNGDRVLFGIATDDSAAKGTMIAHFAMNRHTGELERLD